MNTRFFVIRSASGYTIVMSELALYRKYRPQSFKEVLGQEHIVEALEGAIKLGRVAHAYLFCGPRGTGKTSVARILAKALGTRESDLYEIDAASNRGIDDIRLLRDGVSAVPFESQYKIYIVDEVHMLTKEAFNALLKTLEEPPSHTIFILATTELEKVPDTIVSRCQTFNFRKPSQRILKDASERISKKEGFAIDAPAAELVALLADGSYRDAQGILQKAMGASTDGKITVREVERITGSPRGTLVNSLIEALEKKDTSSGLSVIAKVVEQNVDIKVFMNLLLAKLRFVLLLRNAPDMEKGIREETSAEDFEFLKMSASSKESRITSALLLEFLQVYNLIGYSALPHLPLELAVIKLTHNHELTADH